MALFMIPLKKHFVNIVREKRKKMLTFTGYFTNSDAWIKLRHDATK